MEKHTTINDLKKVEQSDGTLSPQQRLALKNFDRYRFSCLTGIKNEDKFHREFQRLQSMANLTDYQEFLKEDYL